jgi:large subunit ribosomal protein L19
MELDFKPGDLVRVHVKIKESGRERIQTFEGTVISLRGRGENATFTVRRVGVGGIGVERIWPVNSSSIDKIEVKKRGDFRRAKLYFIRNISAKELAETSAKKS